MILCELQGTKGVGGFAALTYKDAQILFGKTYVTVTKLTCDICGDGERAVFLKKIFSAHSRIIGGAAADEMNFIKAATGYVEVGKVYTVVFNEGKNSVCHG